MEWELTKAHPSLGGMNRIALPGGSKILDTRGWGQTEKNHPTILNHV
jgi:hypothetical protein